MILDTMFQVYSKEWSDLGLNQCGAETPPLEYQNAQGSAVAVLHRLSLLPSCSHACPHTPGIIDFFQFLEQT